MRLLLVEDDPILRGRLAEHFRAKGWMLSEAPDAAEGEWQAAEYVPDVAIVDLGLPDRPGLDLIRGWRAAGRDFPILVLTARSDWQDRVGGLEAGADDYVTKPFYLEEVEARLHALLRRVAGRSTAEARFGPIRIDFATRQVCLEDGELTLTTFEFNTLAYLVHRAGEVVSRSDLLDHLYEHDNDRDSNVLEVFVARLRRKLDPTGALRPIETVRGAGYRFRLEPGLP